MLIAVRNFLVYGLIGTLVAGCMIGLLLSGDTLAGAIEGLALGLGVWLTMVGWAYFKSHST